MGGTLLSKSLIQLSVDEWGCVPSLLFDLRPNYSGGNEDNGTSFERSHDALLHSAPLTLLTRTSTGDTQTLKGRSGSDGKASACNAGDPGSIPGSVRSPGEGNGNPL